MQGFRETGCGALPPAAGNIEIADGKTLVTEEDRVHRPNEKSPTPPGTGQLPFALFTRVYRRRVGLFMASSPSPTMRR
jgi:hypothetical protein